jgi:hypothetical protein
MDFKDKIRTLHLSQRLLAPYFDCSHQTLCGVLSKKRAEYQEGSRLRSETEQFFSDPLNFLELHSGRVSAEHHSKVMNLAYGSNSNYAQAS